MKLSLSNGYNQVMHRPIALEDMPAIDSFQNMTSDCLSVSIWKVQSDAILIWRLQDHGNLTDQVSERTCFQIDLFLISVNAKISKYHGVGEKFIFIQKQEIKRQYTLIDEKAKFRLTR